MWVKICANTNLHDAALAAELGTDAVGFVFAPSKRQVTVEQVAAITPHLPHAVEKIGVFQTQNFEEIASAVVAAGLTGVQLHGGVREALAQRLLDRFGETIQLIQTVHWTVAAGTPGEDEQGAARLAEDLEAIARWGTVDRVLIDSKVGGASGGTGVRFDWTLAQLPIQSAQKALHIIVAGGLKPENVADAAQTLHPWGVDVASGVEAIAGRKDPDLLREFIENANRIRSDANPV